ncbi:hypothetical protein ABFS82_13G062300 [Erythranthe guttata]
MRYKSWPFYKDWTQVFGKDRATGENAETFTEAINDLVANSKGKEPMSIGDDYIPQLDPLETDTYSQYMTFSRGDEATSGKTTSKSSKKRRRVDPLDTSVVDMMANFFEKTEFQLSELVSRMGFEKDVSAARKKVFDALEMIENLSFEDRLNVTSRICENSKDLDIFFCLTDAHKASMVKMIIDGRY